MAESVLDDVLVHLLTDWGLKDFAENFTKNQITVDQLIHLNDAELAELIPPIGSRIQFKMKLKKIQKKRKKSDSDDEKAMKPKEKSAKTQCKEKKAEPVFDPDLQKHLIPSIIQTLNKSGEGQVILENYKLNKFLTDRGRTKITDILIKDLSGRTKTATNALLKDLAQKTCEVFPTETPKTYYKSPTKKKDSPAAKKVSIASSGKFPIKWRNMKQLWKVEAVADTAMPEILQLEEEPEDVAPEVESSLKWLEVNDSAELHTAITHWKVTSKRRLQIILKEECTLAEIFDNWKILKQPEAHSLINSDFESMKLSNKIVNDETWLEFVTSVLKLTKEHSNETTKSLKKIIGTIDLPKDSRIMAEVELLCHLIPTKAVIPRKESSKKRWKVSISECFGSMIQYTALFSDIEDLRLKRVDFMLDHGKTVQPYVIVTGPSKKELDGFYLSVNNTLYKLPTLLDALKTCFSTFHVFGAKYPCESEHMWTIIQKVLYGFSTKYDRVFCHTEGIINALTSKKAKSDSESDSEASGSSDSN